MCNNFSIATPTMPGPITNTVTINFVANAQLAVAASGEVDLITDGSIIAYSHGGCHFMEKITGAGCSVGGIVAIYATAACPLPS